MKTNNDETFGRRESLSLDRIRELMYNPNLSLEEASAIREACDLWAELVVEAMEYSGKDWEKEDWYKKLNEDGKI